MSDTYLSTVYGRCCLTKAHLTMRDAFDWVERHVGTVAYRERGVIRRGDVILCEFTPHSTHWYADGFQRWREEQRA